MKFMRIPDRRLSTRLEWKFPVKIHKDVLDFSFGGLSINVSQRGAFIKTENWPCFKEDDRTVVTCLLPPDYTGQNRIIGLEGPGIVRRVDEINGAVAVEFTKIFNQFEPVIEERHGA